MSFPNTKDFDDVSQGRTWIRIQVKYANQCCNPTCTKWIEMNEYAMWKKGVGITCMDCTSSIARDEEDWRQDRPDILDNNFARYVRSKQKRVWQNGKYSGFVTYTPGIIAALSITDEMRKYEAVKKYGIEKIID